MNPVNTKPYILPPDATWLITGCSSGIGASLASLIASKPSQRLIATARDPATLSYLPNSPNVLKLALDVTSPLSIDAVLEQARAHFKESFYLDVVVNNAGYSLSGDTESVTEEEMRGVIDTLFFGSVRVALKGVGIMREGGIEGGGEGKRGGVVFMISSLAGQCAFPGHSFYHAGKWALEGWSESLVKELHPDWNINISIIEPSGVQTNFEGHSKAHTAPHPAYSDPSMPSRVLERYVNMGIKAGATHLLTPSEVAEAIWTLASRQEKIPLRVPLGATAWKMIKAKHQAALGDLEGVKSISSMGKEI